MLIRPAILGPILAIALTASVASGQNAKYTPPQTTVGQLQQVGIVGRTDPLISLGRVGGNSTGRFDALPQSRGYGQLGAGSGISTGMNRPKGVLNARDGLPGYSGASSRIPSTMEFRPRATNPRNTFENNRVQSFATRHQLARSAIPSAAVRETGVLADWRVVLGRRNRMMMPIERLHSDSNLLRPKSALGQLITTQDMALYQAVPPSISPAQPHEPATMMEDLQREAAASQAFENATTLRLKKQYREYERSGVDFFKSKNWIRARDCFDICRSLDRKNPWPRAIDTLVALETNDISRAVNSLTEAVTHGRTLADIHLDYKQLYGSKLEFEKSVDKANFLASQDQTGKFQAGHLLLSYCAWLNGDLATAASAAQAAAKSMPEEMRENTQRYADQLKELAARPAVPTT